MGVCGWCLCLLVCTSVSVEGSVDSGSEEIRVCSLRWWARSRVRCVCGRTSEEMEVLDDDGEGIGCGDVGVWVWVRCEGKGNLRDMSGDTRLSIFEIIDVISSDI